MASTFAVQNPADAVNVALARLGYKLRVGSLYDGSAAAKKALDIYAQTRDTLLRDGDWPFAERNVAGTLLKQAPVGGYFPPNVWSTAYPPLPWNYEYAYLSDCLDVRAVKPTPIFVPNFDPQPNIFAVANDTGFTPPQRVILSNVPNAIIVYTGQVTDPLTWPPDFVEEFAAALARRLAVFVGGPDAVKLEAADEQAEMAQAASEQG